MNYLRAITIDDEKDALEVLRIQLQEYCSNVEVVASCNSGKAGIEAILHHKPDVVFLDIEMPHINGFDVLQQTKHIPFKVIFTTAYNQFAVKAFKFSAVDYLLKPIDIEELQSAVAKVRNMQNYDLEEKLEVLMHSMQKRPESRIALPIGDTIQLFAPNDIIRFESESNYTHIFLASGKKLTAAKTLKEIAAVMEGSSFCRVHQSHLVNLDFVSKIMRGENMYITLKDQQTIPVSRNKREDFLEKFRRI
jgi:two-component system LytT family response regulator